MQHVTCSKQQATRNNKKLRVVCFASYCLLRVACYVLRPTSHVLHVSCCVLHTHVLQYFLTLVIIKAL